MKGVYVFILLLAAIVVATKWHVNKDNAQGDKIDKLDAGLKEVKAHLPAGSSFKLKMPEGIPSDIYIYCGVTCWLPVIVPYPQRKTTTLCSPYVI